MALSLRLLICLLFVACALSADPAPTNATATNATATSAAATSATATSGGITVSGGAPTDDSSGTGATTADGSTGATTPGSTASPTSMPPVTDPCVSSPCGGGSTCEKRADQTYVCLCPRGDYYNPTVQQCLKAKVFPGELTYAKKYVEEMGNKASKEFKEASDEIVGKLNTTYEKDPKNKYLNSIVTKLSPSPATNTRQDKADKLVATVEIMFDKESQITTEKVKETIKNENLGDFEAKTLCVSNICDEGTTNCQETDGTFTCVCKAEYIKSKYSDRECIACPNGMKAVQGACQNCDFGYSGFNCKDNTKLILVIVGSVLGALLLITLILLPVVAMTSKKKSKKAKANDYEKPYSNPAAAKIPQVSNGLAAPRPTPVRPTPAAGLSGFGGNAVPRIPRATTNDSWDRNTNLEMVPSNSRQNLLPAARNSRRFDDDDEDTNPYSRAAKPQSNPYGMGRPQVNPYASSQGSSNPYYRH